MILDRVETAKGKIIGWLREEGFQFKEVEDSSAHFNIVTQVGRRAYHVFQNRGKIDSVTIASNLQFSNEQIDKFLKLNKEDKRSFFSNLRIALLARETLGDFKVKPKPPEQIEQVFISSKPVYYDGLTKDKFISTLYDIHKSSMMTLWLLEETIGDISETLGLQSMYI
jgi:hypothetical protein